MRLKPRVMVLRIKVLRIKVSLYLAYTESRTQSGGGVSLSQMCMSRSWFRSPRPTEVLTDCKVWVIGSEGNSFKGTVHNESIVSMKDGLKKTKIELRVTLPCQ